MIRKMAICEYKPCSSIFIPRTSWQRFCTKKCQRKCQRNNSATKLRLCKNCSTSIPANRVSRALFCSRQCGMKHWRKHNSVAISIHRDNQEAKRKAKIREAQAERNCIWCGHSLAGKRRNTKFCSAKCRETHWRSLPSSFEKIMASRRKARPRACAYNRSRYYANRESILAKMSAKCADPIFRSKRAARVKKWKLANPDKFKRMVHASYLRNIDKKRSYKKKYRGRLAQRSLELQLLLLKGMIHENEPRRG